MEKYQDYVIKDGKFIGKFEEMYQKFDDPWLQTKNLNSSYERFATVTSINRFKIESIIEVGCGLGFFSEFLKQNVKGLYITGIDISETAIKRASEKFPQIDFKCESLIDYLNNTSDNQVYDAILLPEVMWYILDELDVIIDRISKLYRNKYVLINQTFYKGGVQQYGIDYFTSLNEMINRLPWEVLVAMKIEDKENGIYDTHTVFRV